VQFGVSLPAVQQMPGVPDWEAASSPEAIAAVAKRADELGYAWLPCSDHVVVPKRAIATMGATWYEPAATLAFVAGMTQWIRLLTHVIVLPYHNPLAIAKQYATLDRLSGGRVILGVGTGHLKQEFRALNAPFAERGPATDEYIAIIKALWSNEEASFHGKYFQFEEMSVAPRPVQQPHPPIWVGGNSRRAVRRAAALGDGWVPFQVTPEDVRDRLDCVRPLLEQRERPFDVVVPASSVELTDKSIHGTRPPFSGSREQVIEDIRVYEAAGVTGMTAGFRARSLDDQLEKMERFAREIAPAFA
jgi:probable F420-dependent oxidoreductase